MKELVEVIAKSLVEHPDEVVVTETENEKTILVELRVAPSDMGKVIGKQGRIAKAIRSAVSYTHLDVYKRQSGDSTRDTERNWKRFPAGLLSCPKSSGRKRPRPRACAGSWGKRMKMCIRDRDRI